MDYIIRNVTQNLLEKLPDSQSYFKLNDLESHGIPDFVVDRIQVELENNLSESLVPPDTDWANMNTESVQFAWNQFVRAIRAETRLPASYASTVLETSVGDIIDILIQPRKNIPEIIYGNDDKLSYEELMDRIKYIVVYTYLADALPRFMARKQLNELSKEKTKKIIQQIDDRLTAKYTPLNWAQLLEPWFKLIGENLDSDAVKLFFEDKGQQKIAKLFEKEDESINRTRLIEILSNPDLSLREGEKAFSETGQSNESVFAGSQQSVGQQKEEPASPEQTQQSQGQREEQSSGSDADARLEEAKKRLEQLKAQSPSVSDSDATQEPEQPSPESPAKEEEPQQDEEEVPLSQMYSSEEEEKPEEQTAEYHEAPVDDTSGDDEDESEEEEAPIWQRFVSGDEEEEETSAAEPDEDEVDRLANFLSYNEDRFINELFGGEPGAYRDALEQLVTHEDWKSAGRYLHKQIFAPRDIDMYDEAAVDFTDQLQEYFTEVKK